MAHCPLLLCPFPVFPAISDTAHRVDARRIRVMEAFGLTFVGGGQKQKAPRSEDRALYFDDANFRFFAFLSSGEFDDDGAILNKIILSKTGSVLLPIP